jgi:hypothetical protein
MRSISITPIPNRVISWTDKAAENRLVGIGTAYGSDLGVIAFKKKLQICRQLIFDFVDIGCAPVIPFSRVAFCIAMREIGSGLSAHALADNVFAGNQVDASVAPFSLLLHTFFESPLF